MPGSDMISLNVGGHLYMTTESTLRKCGEHSFFTRLLDNRASGRFSTSTDSSGAIFIDRDPAPFERILSFLRSNTINLDSTINADTLLREAEFYGIESLVDILRPPAPSDYCPSSGKLSNGVASSNALSANGFECCKCTCHANASAQSTNNIKIVKFYALIDPSKYECSLSTIIERCFMFYTSKVAVITRQIEEHEWFVTVLMKDCLLDKRGLQKLVSICLACGITNFTFYDGVELTENC